MIHAQWNLSCSHPRAFGLVQRSHKRLNSDICFPVCFHNFLVFSQCFSDTKPIWCSWKIWEALLHFWFEITSHYSLPTPPNDLKEGWEWRRILILKYLYYFCTKALSVLISKQYNNNRNFTGKTNYLHVSLLVWKWLLEFLSFSYCPYCIWGHFKNKKLNSVNFLHQGKIFQAIQFSCVVFKF